MRVLVGTGLQSRMSLGPSTTDLTDGSCRTPSSSAHPSYELDMLSLSTHTCTRYWCVHTLRATRECVCKCLLAPLAASR